MEMTVPAVGVREAKNRFSELTALVNERGAALTVLKNGHPWVVISPADAESGERRKRRARLHALTAHIESSADEPVWDPTVSDKELLGEERLKRFGC